ncbi:unnamed protein product [Durusdinium trenchii]|uniref:Poly [ADP-ribose] polymerase n=1 Tax=Durusdinium trenchii TaxID=1381693 RepID=A0ABP0RGK3_9DINO
MQYSNDLFVSALPQKKAMDQAPRVYAPSWMQRPMEAVRIMPQATAPTPLPVTQLQLPMPQGVPKRKGIDIPIREMKASAASGPLGRPTGSQGVVTGAGGQVPKAELTKTPRDEEDELLFPQDLQELKGSRTPSPEPTSSRQTAKQHLAELLDLWKTTRRLEETAVGPQEKQRIEKVFFETMPSDKVKIVEVKRVMQPNLLNQFCKEEESSMAMHEGQLKTHKEFMLLHGTRWDYAPLIAENGLDPTCGHLAKGSWLGGIAEKAHSYASKGPGPETSEGDRLFALFVVAAVPDLMDGDDERSFGVWRMMSGKRMYPAYHVVYSAPMDIKRKKPLIEPRQNKATLLRKQNLEGGDKADLPSAREGRCRSASPERREEKLLATPTTQSSSPDADMCMASWPLAAATSPALKVYQVRVVGADSPSAGSPSPGSPGGRAMSEDPSSAEDVSRTPSPEPSRGMSVAKQQLGELLEIWKTTRYSPEPIGQNETQCIEKIFFETMPADKVKIVEMKRVLQPTLLRRFVTEEQESIAKQKTERKTHKQFMLMHGTRWDYAPLILENGLDPTCGHLTKGTWLGGIAEKAHSYAAKGPGPEANQDGDRLFALFVVAAVPDLMDGDDERSFGVWRIQSGKRMYTAYHVIYSAPMDIRRKRPLIEPRKNKATMLRKQSLDGIDKIDSPSPTGSKSPRTRSASPPRGREDRLPITLGNQSHLNPDIAASSWPLCPRPVDARMASTSPALKVYQPPRASTAESSSNSPIKRRSSADVATLENRLSPGFGQTQPSLKPKPETRQPAAPKLLKEPKEPKETPKEEPKEAKADQLKDRGSLASAESWEVQLDQGWVPFRPGSKFRDDPGSSQRICHGKFWYTLAFDENGSTGKQINHCTGKVRPLRRVQGPPCAASAGSETSTERPQKHPPQPAAAPNGFPNLLTSANVTF